MAGEQGSAGGGNAPGTGEGGGGSGQQSGAPAGAPSGAASGGGRPAGSAGESLSGLDRSLLPQELQGKSDAELKFILNNMVSTIHSQADTIKKLRGSGSSGGGGGEGRPSGREGGDPPKGGNDDKPKKPLEERILEDPEGVIAEVVQNRYGGVINNLNSRTARSELSAARQAVPDFGEYEEDVLSMMEQTGAEPTMENYLGAYTFLVGQRTLEERRQAAQAGAGMENGDGKPQEEDSGKPKLTELEREVARNSGMTDEQFIAARDMDVFDAIRVPTGQRKESE